MVRLIILGLMILIGFTGTAGTATGFTCLRDLGTSFIFSTGLGRLSSCLGAAGAVSSGFLVAGMVSVTGLIL